MDEIERIKKEIIENDPWVLEVMRRNLQILSREPFLIEKIKET